jgi:hypothetical protein
MAIVANGVVNALSDASLPSGYTRPTITTFNDHEWQREVTLNVLKATVENATQATTMTNILTNGTVGLTKQITDIVAADFLTTPAVTWYAKLVDLNTNIPVGQESNFTYLGNTAVSYVCKVVIYLKAV